MFQQRTASFAYKLLFDFDSNVLITMNKTPQNINGLTNDSGFVDIFQSSFRFHWVIFNISHSNSKTTDKTKPLNWFPTAIINQIEIHQKKPFEIDGLDRNAMNYLRKACTYRMRPIPQNWHVSHYQVIDFNVNMILLLYSIKTAFNVIRLLNHCNIISSWRVLLKYALETTTVRSRNVIEWKTNTTTANSFLVEK